MIPAYSKIYNLGRAEVAPILVGGLPEWYKDQLARNAPEPVRVESALAASQPQAATQA